MQETILEQQNLTALFNAASQITAIFSIGLLIGLSIIGIYLENSIYVDESRADFLSELRRTKFYQMIWVSALNFFTILCSLLMIHLSSFEFRYKNVLALSVFMLNLVSLASGFLVMLSILNPRKIEKTAKQILSENKLKLGLTGKQVKEDYFFQDFIRLEQKMKEYIVIHKIGIVQGDRRQSFQSFRQMVEMLYYDKRIDRECYDLLQQINKYRNLVFHGHIQTVDAGMIEKIRKALKFVSSLPKERLGESEPIHISDHSSLMHKT